MASFSYERCFYVYLGFWPQCAAAIAAAMAFKFVQALDMKSSTNFKIYRTEEQSVNF